MARSTIPLLLLLSCVTCPCPAAEPATWYWDSPVNIHWDNHSGPLGKGLSVDQIADMFAGLDVDLIQVSARSTPYATFPTRIGLPNPTLGDYDTLATWRAVTRKLGKRLGVYINTIEEPRMTEEHPEWMSVNASGGRTGLCLRPSADGRGYLETILIPLVREIIARYDPDGFWFDGDYAVPPVCYCASCRAAWARAQPGTEPPRDARDPQWAQWVTLARERYTQYREKLAAAIHEGSARCMYTSNWSWAISHREPTTAPPFADTLSGDVGGGSSAGALYGLRAACLFLSAQEHTAHDVMSAIYPKAVRTLPRMLQEGGLVMAAGSSWFLWVNALTPQQFAHLQACVGLVTPRRAALGYTLSLNPVAVLLSETSWVRGLTAAERGSYDSTTPRNLAFALQDAGYGVDMVNEETLRERLAGYRVVCIPEQRTLAPETTTALRGFAERGGTVIVSGAGLRPAATEDPDCAAWLGVTRPARLDGERQALATGGARVPLKSPWRLEVGAAQVVDRFAGSELPALTARSVGQGRVVTLALAGFPYPDEDGLVAWLMGKLKLAPMVRVQGPAAERHLVFSARRRADGQVIVHVADLTTLVNGKRVEPNSSHQIDPVPPIPEVALELAMPTEPTRVTVVPAGSTVTTTWRDGILSVKLTNVAIHAAVIVETVAPPCLGLLPDGTPPTVVRHYERPPVLLAEDFEAAPVGKFPPHPLWVANTDAKTAIRVTATTAASGAHSLEFVDDPAARASFVPYLVLSPRDLDRGRARFSCDLRLEPDAVVDIELRDETGDQLVGPSVRFTGRGQVLAGGKEVARVPAGEWCHVVLDFGLGFEPPAYTLELTPAGGTAQRIAGLPYRDAGFARCTWLGMIAYSPRPARLYADSIRLERLPDAAKP